MCGFHRKFFAALCVALLLTGSSCFHYRVAAPGPERPATDYKGKMAHAYLWGMFQKPNPITPDNCPDGVDLYDVRVTTNYAYLLVSVLSLGIWVPMEIEWRCAKKPSPDFGFNVATDPVGNR